MFVIKIYLFYASFPNLKSRTGNPFKIVEKFLPIRELVTSFHAFIRMLVSLNFCETDLLIRA